MPAVIDFADFGRLDPSVAGLTRGLIAEGTREPSAFSSFMHVWMGFNGWMECVVDADTDRDMIDALATNARLSIAYDDLLARSADFRLAVGAFTGLWPVLKVRAVRKTLDWDAFQKFTRDELIIRGAIAYPEGWNVGSMPTWAHIIRTIYLIRCNLFHGAKSPHNDRDRDLVQSCGQVLLMFINGSRCLDWG